MNLRPLVLSVAIHAVLVGAAWIAVMRVTVDVPADPEPVFLELVEDDSPPAAEPPRPVETVRESEPFVREPEPPAEPTPVAAEEPGESPPDLSDSVPPLKPEPSRAEEEPAPIVAGNVERAKVISAPQALGRVMPVYPRSARRKGREGSVIVEATVLENGAVADVKIVSTSGFADLDRAAATALRQATFAPAREDGVAVDGQIRLTFDFRLDR